MTDQTTRTDPLDGVTIGGHKCFLVQSRFPDGWIVASKDCIYNSYLSPHGRWSGAGSVLATREAAIEFCLKHADKKPSPASTGKDLPDAPGRWRREDGEWDVLVRQLVDEQDNDELWVSGWCINDEGSLGVESRVAVLPKGGWMFQRTPLSDDERAKLVERLRERVKIPHPARDFVNEFNGLLEAKNKQIATLTNDLSAANKRAESAETERDVYRAVIEAATLVAVDKVSASTMREAILHRNEEFQRLKKENEALITNDREVLAGVLKLQQANDALIAERDRWKDSYNLLTTDPMALPKPAEPSEREQWIREGRIKEAKAWASELTQRWKQLEAVGNYRGH